MSGGEEVKTVDMAKKMTPAQQEAAMKRHQKAEAMRLADYKKGLQKNVELKRLQVEELELNIRMYNAKVKWRAMRSDVEELDAKEQAEYQEEMKQRKALIDAQREEAEKAVAAEKVPEIVIPKVGKPREKEVKE